MKLFLNSVLLFCCSVASADEGMWLINNFPAGKIKEKYNFSVTEKWLEHVRLSSARMAGGCSASFVSKNGLVLTNHHCTSSCIEQLSSEKKDFVAEGFLAKTQDQEIKCPEIEINRLVQITDVTARVQKATSGLSGSEYGTKLRSESSTIEKECAGDDDSVRCEVVSLYQGGLFHLYRYQRYQDVRLVFAPEASVAFFGGDPDNFNFPRYNLDVSFLRVYENNKPLTNNHYFRWSKAGLREGDLTFIAGHPGRTSRLMTVAQLKFQRDVRLFSTLLNLAELRGVISEFQKRGDEQKRVSTAALFGIENAYKALKGEIRALQDETFLNSKTSDEKSFIRAVNANPKLKKSYANSWKEVESAYEDYRNIYTELDTLEHGNFGSKLMGFARHLVRAPFELEKPNGRRFREYRDSALPELRQYLLSSAPIHDEFEITMLTYGLTKARERLGADHAFIKSALGKSSPAELAATLIKNTKLKDRNYRKQLLEGGIAAIDSSKDPLIQFFRNVDPFAREIRKKYEDEIDTRIKKNTEQIARARFAIYGTKRYPDATFTLRLSYGQVKGYAEKGRPIAPITSFKGIFERHTGSDPFKLPNSWLSAKNRLNLEAPFNFCSDNDIVGGNSGSPVLNRDAEIVGLAFDGNIHSLGGDYGFDGNLNRAISVHSGAVLEALNKIYGAQRIVDDIFSD